MIQTEDMQLLRTKLQEAELVLLGIGEEWEIKEEDYRQDAAYETLRRKLERERRLKEEEAVCQLSWLKKRFLDEASAQRLQDGIAGYRLLKKLLEGKNYFIVSLCTDGLIKKAGLDEERIVTPCGGYEKLQCKAACSTDLYEPDAFLTGQEKDRMPVCPKCGEPLVFNNIAAENYVEEGYLADWNRYTKWLQGTLNRRVCILELGVGMRFPTVIRWPFEKAAFFNNKAVFFRVHSRLYQLTEELKEKGHCMEASPEMFLQALSAE